MKQIYLRIEYYKGGKFLFAETHNANMSKDFIYFGDYKIKKADTEAISEEETDKILHGRINRLIKINDSSKKKDARFILVC